MGWDSSRVSAAIPSGVGFLGAASIWKGTKTMDNDQGHRETVPEVHGLTTATSVWLSAAIGILCGGGLYVPGLFTTAAGVVYLRFAPRLNQETSEPDEADDEDDDEESADRCGELHGSGKGGGGVTYDPSRSMGDSLPSFPPPVPRDRNSGSLDEPIRERDLLGGAPKESPPKKSASRGSLTIS